MSGSKFILSRACGFCSRQFSAKTVYSKYCSQTYSESASRIKKILLKLDEKRQQLTAQIPVDRPYITIAEAV